MQWKIRGALWQHAPCIGFGHSPAMDWVILGSLGSPKIHGCSNAGWPHDVWEYAPNAIVFASLVWLYFLRYWSPGKSKYHKLRCGIRMNWNEFDDLSDEFRMWKGMILMFFLPFFWCLDHILSFGDSHVPQNSSSVVFTNFWGIQYWSSPTTQNYQIHMLLVLLYLSLCGTINHKSI